MRLQQKTGRYYLLFSGVLLALTGIALFHLITSFINEETNEKLLANAIRIQKAMDEGYVTPSLPPIIDMQISSKALTGYSIKDTILYDPVEGENELFRELTYHFKLDKTHYSLSLRQVILEQKDYVIAIGIPLAFLMLILFLGLYYFNRNLVKRLWQPFYHNLQVLHNYSLDDSGNVPLLASGIDEFQHFKEIVERMLTKIEEDYSSLKEFTENASHELQTPLAIIRVKLENLLQDDVNSEERMHLLEDALEALGRLSRLNQSLLLLSKIENQHFTKKESTHIKEVIEKLLLILDDLLKERDLHIFRNYTSDKILIANRDLVEVLISNLLSNAINHNIKNGEISIDLDDNEMSIKNTGKSLREQPERYFERFKKDSSSSHSNGLGLAIVHKICKVHDWQITYTHHKSTHVIKVIF